MIKALFWDNDGVLVDTERLYFQANLETLALDGITLNAEIFREFWLKSSRGLLYFAQHYAWSDEQLEARRNWRNERYSELLSTTDVLIPNVVETLKAVSKNMLQAIVTSSRRDHFDLIHARANILHFFHFVIAEGDYQFSKPNPEPYLIALKRSGLAASECLVIEDSERGLQAAHAAGLRCVVLRNDLSAGANFAHAEAVLDSVQEIPSFLDRYKFK